MGPVEPIVVNRPSRGRLEVVSGHQRLGLLLEAGVKRARCVILELPSAEAKALAPLAAMSRHFELVGYVIVVAYSTLWAWMLLISRRARSAEAARAAIDTSATLIPLARSSPEV